MAKTRGKPPAAEPPTREEVLALPFWPRVAFCARVARRVLPLVEHCWEKKIKVAYTVPKGRLRGTRSCVRQTELAAAHAGVVSEEKLYAAFEVANDAAAMSEYAAEEAGRQEGSRPYAASYAATVAVEAARGAFTKTRPGWNMEWGLVVGFATDAAEAFGAARAVNAALRADYERLKRLVAERQWGDDTPVSPRVFGPLWPQGAPKGWPEGR